MSTRRSARIMSAPKNANGIVTCSIHSPPIEVLSHIFREYVDLYDFDADTHSPRRASYSARVTLCSLDHYLRSAAIRTPWLWTFIRLYSPSKYPSIPFLSLCIERSGSTRPLHIDFDSTRNKYIDMEPHHDLDKQFMVESFTFLLPHLPRWKSLKISVARETEQFFVSLRLFKAESLESIDIITTAAWEDSLDFLTNITYGSPSVRHLKLFRAGLWSPTFSIPNQTLLATHIWEYLQHVELDFPLAVSQVLRLFTALVLVETVYLEVRRFLINPIEGAPIVLIHRPRIRELICHAGSEIYDALRYIELPGIRILKVKSPPPTAGTWIRVRGHGEHYRSFITHTSRAPMEDCEFDVCDVETSYIEPLFNLPQLLSIPKAKFLFANEEYDPDLPETIRRITKSIKGRKLGLEVYVEKDDVGGYIVGWTRNGGRA